MTDAAKKLLEEVLALPEEDRRWIAEMLTEHVPAPTQDEIDEAWRTEALRRTEETERGAGEVLDGPTAVREIEQELRALRSR